MPRKLRPLPPPDIIRARLRALIEADGRQAGEIAEAAGMSAAQLSQILTGVRDNPGIKTVRRVLDAMGHKWKALD